MKLAIAILLMLLSGCHAKVVHRGDYPVTIHDGEKVLAHCQKWDNKKVVVSECQIEKGVTLDQVLTALAQQIYEPASAPEKAEINSKI